MPEIQGLNFLHLFTLMIFGLGSFFLSFLIFYKRRKNLAVRLLTVILTIVLYEQFIHLLVQSKQIYLFPFLFHLEWLFDLALYPLLLIFIYEVFNKDFVFRRRYWLFFLPFLWGVVDAFPYLLISAADKKAMIDLYYGHGRPGPIDLFSNLSLFLKRIGIPSAFLGFSLFYLVKNRLSFQYQHSKLLYRYVMLLILAFFLFRVFSQLIYKYSYALTIYEGIEHILDSLLLTMVVLLLCYLLINELTRKKIIAIQWQSADIDGFEP